MDAEPVQDNIHALQLLYFAAMLEDLRVFDVADRLLELFQSGLLPIEDHERAERMFGEWRDARARLSEKERRDVYARVLGVPGGEEPPAPNREFAGLWLRFLSAVSTFERPPEPVSNAIQRQVTAAIALVSHPEIRAARSVMVRAAVRDLVTRSASFADLPASTQQQIAHDMAEIAEYLLREVDFPAFVGDLIEGTFGAIVNASIRQMEAYAELVKDVAQSLDEFRDENRSDDEARDYLAKKVGRVTRPATSRQQLLSTMVLMGINRIVSERD